MIYVSVEIFKEDIEWQDSQMIFNRRYKNRRKVENRLFVGHLPSSDNVSRMVEYLFFLASANIPFIASVILTIFVTSLRLDIN